MNLKKLREKAGLKQSELAAISGVNLRSLQDYEQGHKSIGSAKGETLLRLSYALNCSIEDILEGSVEIENLTNNLKSRNMRIGAYERHLIDRKEKEVHFPIVVADELVDMSRIYPTKQGLVKNVLAQLRADKRVKSLRLFGSSISMACHKDSDIDFAVDIADKSRECRNEISEKLQIACNWSADIIWMDHLAETDRVYKDIMKGLVLI